jgi:hypothetical protein
VANLDNTTKRERHIITEVTAPRTGLRREGGAKALGGEMSFFGKLKGNVRSTQTIVGALSVGMLIGFI